MKNTLMALAFATFFVACNSKPKEETAILVVPTDTVSMDHNSFTDQGVEMNLDGVSDTIVGPDGAHYIKAGTNVPAVNQPKRAVATNTGNTTSKSTASSSTSTASTGSGNADVSSAGSGTTVSTAPVVKKKRFSNTLKGAVIGGTAGAAAGAIIGKKKVKSAIIGGVVGAGSGYVIGRVIDGKDPK